MDTALPVEDKRPRRRGALVERQDVFLLHDDSPSVRIGPSHLACVASYAGSRTSARLYTGATARLRNEARRATKGKSATERRKARRPPSLNMACAQLRNKSDRPPSCIARASRPFEITWLERRKTLVSNIERLVDPPKSDKARRLCDHSVLKKRTHAARVAEIIALHGLCHLSVKYGTNPVGQIHPPFIRHQLEDAPQLVFRIVGKRNPQP